MSNHNISKLDPQAIKCVFIEYSPIQKGYKCYHPSTRRLYISIDVTFEEAQNEVCTNLIHSPIPYDYDLPIALRKRT